MLTASGEAAHVGAITVSRLPEAINASDRDDAYLKLKKEYIKSFNNDDAYQSSIKELRAQLC